LSKTTVAKFIKKAEKAFEAADFATAKLNYHLAIAADRNSQEALVGIMMCALHQVSAELSTIVFELYTAMRSAEGETANAFALALIDSLEKEEFSKRRAADEWIDAQDGIAYDDFKQLLSKDGSFTALYEKIVWSTNVFISRKNDWIDFVDKLIDHGYTELAYRYIEGALPLWGMDEKTHALLTKLRQKERGAVRGAK
jgi:hypothetical protein